MRAVGLRLAHRELLLAPGSPALLIAAFIGRLPLGMMALALLLLLVDAGYGYGEAGLVTGVVALPHAVVAPMLGRVIDRRGQTVVLVALGMTWPTTLSAFIFLATNSDSLWLLIACVALIGATLPPVTACVRAVWPALLADLPGGRERAFALTRRSRS